MRTPTTKTIPDAKLLTLEEIAAELGCEPHVIEPLIDEVYATDGREIYRDGSTTTAWSRRVLIELRCAHNAGLLELTTTPHLHLV